MVKEILLANKIDVDKIKEGCIYSFLNLASIGSIFDDKKGRSEIIYAADGMLLALMFSLLTKRKVGRYSFDYTSLARPFFLKCRDNQQSIFLFGASEVELERFIRRLSGDYHGLQILGVTHGFIGREKWDMLIEKIIKLSPDYTIVGLGAGLQDEFLLKLKQSGYLGTGITCGGFIRQESGSSKQYYPEWINNLRLRAFYRMWKEPHTIKRYLFDYPINALKLIYTFYRKDLLIKPFQ